MYGVYGGLHIAPFGPLKPPQEAVVKGMGKYNFKKVAANHCTGIPAVKKMIELGYPVVKGTGRFGSKSRPHDAVRILSRFDILKSNIIA